MGARCADAMPRALPRRLAGDHLVEDVPEDCWDLIVRLILDKFKWFQLQSPTKPCVLL